ncbi:hypothetical protein AVEN_166716-1, partial [Araneus ventricosus]
ICVKEIRRWSAVTAACSTRRRHWRNATSPETFSGAGTDGRRWEQDRDYRRDGQTPPSETAAAVAAKRPPVT